MKLVKWTHCFENENEILVLLLVIVLVMSRSYDSSFNVDTPDSLQDLCIFYCCNNLQVLVSSLCNVIELNENAPTTLTTLLGDKILNYYLRCHVGNDKVAKHSLGQLLKKIKRCHSLCLKRQDILTGVNLGVLENNQIKQLEITYFNELHPNCITSAVEFLIKNNLCSISSFKLNIKTSCTNYTHLLKLLAGESVEVNKDVTTVDVTKGQASCDSNNPKDNQATQQNNPLSTAEQSVYPNSRLKNFTLISVCYDTQPESNVALLPMIKVLKENLQIQTLCIVSLNHLLCDHILRSNVLQGLSNLQSLILSSVLNRNSAQELSPGLLFDCLPVLQQLRHLDLSRHDPTQCYQYPEVDVESFIQAVMDMPKLTSLELAGTNLSQIICHDDKNDEECHGHCMPGFEGRVFQYIGLFSCERKCHHRFIPAFKVSGNANEDQLLVSTWSYHQNMAIMQQVLIQVRKGVRDRKVTKAQQFIEAVVAYLEEISDTDFSYSSDGKELYQLKICLSIIYGLQTVEVEELVTIKHKRRRLERLLVVLDNGIRDGYCHVGSSNAVWILCTTINILVINKLAKVAVYCHMFVPFVKTMLKVYNYRSEPTTRLKCLCLIHEAVEVSQEHKVVAGDTCKLVKLLLAILRDTMPVICQDTHTVAAGELFGKVWSIILTLTDGVESNSRLFLKYLGHTFAYQCYKQFPRNRELHGQISVTLVNVLEFPDCRDTFMTPTIIEMFREMLVVDITEATNYNVDSHAADALLMLASDGSDVWEDRAPNHSTIPSRDAILKEIDNAIKKWDINKCKGIEFKSLAMMLKMIQNSSTPVAQYWGAWKICNLVTVEPSREIYCVMLKVETGEAIIRRTLEQQDLRQDVRKLLNQILQLSGIRNAD